MKRMGIIGAIVLALALIVAPLSIADYSDATDEAGSGDSAGSGSVDQQSTEQEGEESFTLFDWTMPSCTVGADIAFDEASVKKWIEEIWMTGLDWGTITGGETDYSNGLTVQYTSASYKPAVNGTVDDVSGVDGEIKFKLVDETEKKTTNEIVCTITPVKFDLSSIPCKVPMSVANTKDDVKAWLESEWIQDDTLVFVAGDFTPAEAGSSEDNDGTSGSLKFSVTKGGTEFQANLVCTITPNTYHAIKNGEATLTATLPDDAKLTVGNYCVTKADLESIFSDSDIKTTLNLDPGVLNILITGVTDAKTGDVYYTGSVLKVDGDICILMVSDHEYAIHEVGSEKWDKYDLETGEKIGTYVGDLTEEADKTRVNIGGVTYIVGYYMVDSGSSLLSDRNYTSFFYTESGEAAGYCVFKGKTPYDMDSEDTFVFNPSKSPAFLSESDRHIGIITEDDGDVLNIYQHYSKTLSVDGITGTLTGKVTIDLGVIEDAGRLVFVHKIPGSFENGTVTKAEDGSYTASMDITSLSPFMVLDVVEDEFSAVVSSPSFTSQSDDDDGGINGYHILGIIVGIGAVVGVMYFVMNKKP